MTKYSVSRFRFSNETHNPKSSDIVTLVPINYDADNQTADIYIGLDTIETIFLPYNLRHPRPSQQSLPRQKHHLRHPNPPRPRPPKHRHRRRRPRLLFPPLERTPGLRIHRRLKQNRRRCIPSRSFLRLRRGPTHHIHIRTPIFGIRGLSGGDCHISGHSAVGFPGCGWEFVCFGGAGSDGRCAGCCFDCVYVCA